MVEMKVAYLVMNPWQGADNRLTDGALPIGDHAFDRDRELSAYTRCFLQQRNEILFRGSEQTARHQDFL